MDDVHQMWKKNIHREVYDDDDDFYFVMIDSDLSNFDQHFSSFENSRKIMMQCDGRKGLFLHLTLIYLYSKNHPIDLKEIIDDYAVIDVRQ